MEKDTSEIAKLAERIAKDPKSKLFVPLAEEHKKAGNIAMAIQVLNEGLKNNPSYVTARSFLGRLLLEQGDLSGAQKELEEVIKSIPDNLLAQRKLGDLYVLQGKAQDAAQRYKAALALNPADKELPSLIADIGAGKDVSSRVPQPKVPAAPPKSAPAAPAPPKAPTAAPVKPAAPAAPKPAAATAAPPKAPAQPEARPAAPAAQAAPAAPPKAPAQPEARPAAPAAQSAPATPPKAPAQPEARPAVPAAQAVPAAPPKPVPAAVAAPPAQTPDVAEVVEEIVSIEAIEQPAAAPHKSEPAPVAAAAQSESLSFDLSESPEPAPASAEETAMPVWGAADAVTAAPEPVPSAPAAEEGGDDLNTNTLAELYITQGFYDKALEVYQGMLGDRPGNKVLLQKVEQLKAMAGEQAASEPLATSVSSSREYTPPPAEPVAETARISAAPARPAAPAPAPPAAAAAGPVPVQRGQNTASTRRKETIDRLESWLKNVKKENQ